MKSLRIQFVFAVCLIAGVSTLAAQEQANASIQASSDQAQTAVALVSKQYTINQDARVVGTKKPLPKNGTWGVRQAQESERVAECGSAGAICREVLYHASQPEIVCGWTVLFPASGGAARVVNVTDPTAMYMLRFFTTEDRDTPKKIRGQPPLMPPIAMVARMTGTVVLRTVVDTTGMVQAISVASSTNPMFNNYAIDGVNKWQMEPFILNGKALPYQALISIRFQ